MKAMLQLIVFVLNAHTEFRERCSNSPSIQQINKAGRKMKSQPPSFPLQHDFSQNSNTKGR